MVDATNKAKEMEKEQIMLASGAGYKDGILYANGEQWIYESPEQYYNETYKQD
jgi:lipopolysaccharide biosynthesis glycosyltransferase